MQTYRIVLSNMRPACVILRWALAFALLFGAMAAQAAITITRTSSPVFYIDTSITPALTGMYASYQITSTTDVPDAWVRAESFTGGVVGLGPNEDGVVHLGALTAGGHENCVSLLDRDERHDQFTVA